MQQRGLCLFAASGDNKLRSCDALQLLVVTRPMLFLLATSHFAVANLRSSLQLLRNLRLPDLCSFAQLHRNLMLPDVRIRKHHCELAQRAEKQCCG